MSDDAALQTITQLVFVAIFVLTVVDFARRRTRARLEIALLFGSLAVIIVIQGLTRLTGIASPQASLIGALVILAEPYLLLRLVAHFRPVPRIQHVIGVGYVAMSWVIEIGATIYGDPNQLPPPVTLAIILPFAYLEGYAAVAFVQSARTSRGITQRRLIAAALGSGFLGAVILMAGVVAVWQSTVAATKIVSDLLSLASAVSYYIGFAPPTWLRRMWQISEFEMFLSGLAGRTAEDRFTEALDRLGPTVARALGSKGAIVALGNETSGSLTIRPDSSNEEALGQNGIQSISLAETNSLLSRAWHERRNKANSQPETWGSEISKLVSAFGGAHTVLVSPLAAHGHLYGLLVVLFNERSVFFESQLLLTAMAEQAALAIAGAQLMDQMHEQNVALEAASRLKSKFLANMSHELRTPLNAILGFSELLMDEPAGEDDPEMRATYLERIHESGKHLLSLINDILDLAKVEAGRMELHNEEVVIGDLVEQVLGTVQPLAEHKGIRLGFDLAQAGVVFGDAGKLKQILYNLLSNAIKFTPDGGEVRVEAHEVPDAGAVELTVIDTGIGIASEDQERVFQEFQQIDGEANRRYEGTGLGLTLTKRFVELHGGRIWLDSEKGRGSRFHILLPRGAGRAAEMPEQDAEEMARLPIAVGARGLLVLVVEDDPSAAHLLSVYLTRGGYQVASATTGRQALEQARALQPAAITLDVMLPEMDGWQVLRELKADPATRDIPVIVASIVENEPLGYALGATDYLVKPIDRETLLAKLARYALELKGGQVMTVLAVDDDPAALDLVAGILEPVNFKVLKASSGAEALTLAEQYRPNAMLLDLMMPELSGFEVVTAMRLNPATKDIPIIVVTAKDLTSEERNALNGDVSAVFHKGSLRAAELRVSLAAALGPPKQPKVSRAHA